MSDLEKLSELAAQLNAETDTMNATIAELDARLSGMHVGLAVWDEHVLCPGGDGRTGWLLGYERLSSGYGLAARQVWQGEWEHEGAGSIPLLKAPRLVRIEAVARFNVLIGLLAQRAEQALACVRGAQSQLGSR